MSYILDALNKSEQERKSKDTPNLDTVHRVLHPRRPDGLPWITVLVVLVILNVLIAIYWFTSRDTGTTGEGSPDVVASPESPAAGTLKADRLPARNSPPPSVQATVKPPEPAVETEEPAQLITPDDYFKRQVPTPATPSAVRFAELPLSVQQQIPEIRISSHIYGTDPGFRMANINDQIVREGDMLTDDIRLDEITEEGVILQYLHYRFEIRIQ